MLLHGLLICYTSMVLAFLMVYFWVRSYRDGDGGSAQPEAARNGLKDEFPGAIWRIG